MTWDMSRYWACSVWAIQTVSTNVPKLGRRRPNERGSCTVGAHLDRVVGEESRG